MDGDVVVGTLDDTTSGASSSSVVDAEFGLASRVGFVSASRLVESSTFPVRVSSRWTKPSRRRPLPL